MASSSTILTLPLDLIRGILYRIPAESLVRSKTTCRQLNDLINDNSFIYEYLHRSKEKFLRIDGTVQIMDPVTSKSSESPIPNELQPYTIIASVHCNGLMLCMCSDMRSRFGNLALWNPLTRKFSWVDEPSREGFVISYFGIGYVVTEPHLYDYKILKFSARLNGEVEVEIYECMSKSWRTLDDVTKVDWDVDPSCNGVSVMGNMYWLAKKETRNYVLGFDFSDETFKDICSCRLLYDTNYLGCYEGDKLSLVEQNQEEPSPIEVWVSTKLADGNVSFVQYFKVDSFNLPALRFSPYTAYPVYCIAKDKRIIAWCEDDVNHDLDWVSSSITLYEIDGARVRNKHETERHHGNDYVETFFCGYVYVPSLVPLPV